MGREGCGSARAAHLGSLTSPPASAFEPNAASAFASLASAFFSPRRVCEIAAACALSFSASLNPRFRGDMSPPPPASSALRRTATRCAAARRASRAEFDVVGSLAFSGAASAAAWSLGLAVCGLARPRVPPPFFAPASLCAAASFSARAASSALSPSVSVASLWDPPPALVALPPSLSPPSLLSSLTLYAYLRVLSVCSQLPVAGETLAIITVRLSPMNESRRTSVSFDPRNGTCPDPRSSARMHSFSASKDLLISAPSMRVWRSFSEVSAPRSEPAKSMKENLPWTIAWQFAPPAAFSRRCAKTDAGTCRFRPPLGPAPPRADDPFVAE